MVFSKRCIWFVTVVVCEMVNNRRRRRKENYNNNRSRLYSLIDSGVEKEEREKKHERKAASEAITCIELYMTLFLLSLFLCFV
jgi:hypothetical protein